jgi:DtxR family Mn-dependent transcriptional regulator/ferrous iron transport protein A
MDLRAHATVEALQHDTEGHWRKLLSLGIAPGVRIEMVQRWPAFVVRVGHTEVALDKETAELVTVRA